VREAVEKSNERAYGDKELLRFYNVLPEPGKEAKDTRSRSRSMPVIGRMCPVSINVFAR